VLVALVAQQRKGRRQLECPVSHRVLATFFLPAAVAVVARQSLTQVRVITVVAAVAPMRVALSAGQVRLGSVTTAALVATLRFLVAVAVVARVLLAKTHREPVGETAAMALIRLLRDHQ
jgi:putative effector of murein hydrolase LrgA (UPF0299 family)